MISCTIRRMERILIKIAVLNIPNLLINKVLKNKADIGIAFDGDGDRLIAVDENGKILSGDKILAISAIIMKKNGVLTNNHVVSTVMSNMGLVSLFKEKGINYTMTQVGDRYVMQEMIKTGSVIGGEDSGHIIFFDHQQQVMAYCF